MSGNITSVTAPEHSGTNRSNMAPAYTKHNVYQSTTSGKLLWKLPGQRIS